MSWAAKYVGIPYKPQGRSISGCDCYGLLWLVLTEVFGYAVPPIADLRYEKGREAELAQAMREYEQSAGQWAEVEPGQERAGDAILLRLAGHPIHVGVVAQPGLMLHVERGTHATLEAYGSIRWRNRVRGFRRWVGSRSPRK